MTNALGQQLQDLANDHGLELKFHNDGDHVQLIGRTEQGLKVVANWWPYSHNKTVWIDRTKTRLTGCDLHDFVEQTIEATARINTTEPRHES